MKKFDIVKLDWEERFGISALGGTAVRKFSSLVLGAILTAVFYGILSLLRTRWGGTVGLEMFFPGGHAGRTFIPVLTVLLGMWTLSILLLKRSKLKVQTKALNDLPAAGDPEEQRKILSERFDKVEDFIAAAAMAERCKLDAQGLSELEITGVMESYFNDVEKDVDNTYMPVSCFIWSIPVLGFIGTVLGLAKAVSNFGFLSGTGDKASFEAVLPQITGGLATAFETTLIALIMALILQIFSSFLNQSELAFITKVKSAVMQKNCSKQEQSEE